MSNHENETIKENIYEELLDCGYTDEQIERYDMVDLLFYSCLLYTSDAADD